MIRAIRKRYFARSLPGSLLHTREYARRAAFTARSTSASEASATSASTSSVAGLIVLNDFPEPSTNSPLMKRPYDDLMSTIERDSGAGAYSKNGAAVSGTLTMIASVQGEVVGTAVAAGGDLGALHQQVVEQRGGAEAEPVRVEPVLARHLVDHHEVLDRVLAGPDAAGRLHTDHLAGGLAEVADGLEHDHRDRQGRGRLHLARGGLDEVAAGHHREPGGAAYVVVGLELA